jgi:DNA polymerase-3 subunit alpha (Gram-positive type)
MDITLSVNKIIPYGIIEDFKRQVAQKFNLNKLVIRVKYADVDFNNFNYELYYENLVFYVNELVPGVRHVFTDSTAKFADGKYIISLKYGTELIENTKCLGLMERIVLSQLGCNMEFEFVDDRNEEAINKLKEETIQKLEKIAIPTPVEENKTNEEEKSEIIFGKPIKEDCVGIDTIANEETCFVIVKGEVLNSEFRELKNKKFLLTFFIADNKSAFSAKCFLTDKQYKSVKGRIKDGVCVKIKGRIQYDTFKKENTIMIGDDWEADIVGAKNMGIDQIFFNRTNILTPFAPTYEVNHISMIKKLL